MKKRTDFKPDRISGKKEILIDNDEVGKIAIVGKLKYGYIKYNIGLTSDEFRRIADIMDKK